MNKYAFGAAVVLGMVVVLLSSLLPPTVPSALYNSLFLAMLFLCGLGGYLASTKTGSLIRGAVGGALLALLSAGLPLLAGIVLDSQFRENVAAQALGSLQIFLIGGLLCGAVGAAARNITSSSHRDR
jgi:hypothetical protein